MPTAVPSVLRARCRVCSHFRDAREFVANPVIGYCWHCYEKHLKALAVLAGAPPDSCGECGVTFRTLRDRAAGADVRMMLHIKDGVYQLLCHPCSDAYERKRADLYGSTPYGDAKKLRGTK